MFDFRSSLTAASRIFFQENFGLSTDVHFDVSFDESHGDFTTSIALQVAKDVKKKPRDIAELLANHLRTTHDVERVDVAGPGFVNVTCHSTAFLQVFAIVTAAVTPSARRETDPLTIVEYCSLNIAKPFGIHHILVTMIGQAIANLYAHDGANLLRWNYFGDWGTQFGKLFVAFTMWGTQPLDAMTLDDLLQLYVRFHQEAEKDESLEEKGKEAFHRLEQGSTEVRDFWEACVRATKAAVTPVLDRLSVRFDSELGESHYEHAMAPIINEGKKKGVFVEGEKGALIVRFPEEMHLPPAVVLKSDGATNYLTRDLALIRDRVDRLHAATVLHIVGAEQTLHFRQLMETARLLGWTLPGTWEHISFGRMHFADQSMSTRKGNVIKLEDVMNEAVARARAIIKDRGEKIQTDDPEALAEMMGIGSLVYGILSQNRKMDIIFDWDKMLSFEGNSAPYIQYTHARACSVLRKANVHTDSHHSLSRIDALSPHEKLVLKRLLCFGEALTEARVEHLPHKVATYLYELCQAFNAFYNADDILTAPPEVRVFRLALTDAVKRVLKTGAELLTLRVPDRM